jgi:hypothetical protein
MRILYLTQYSPPEMRAPQARLRELMSRMIDLGHSVTILTTMPNDPLGKGFSDHRGRLTARKPYQGMMVLRTVQVWLLAQLFGWVHFFNVEKP